MTRGNELAFPLVIADAPPFVGLVKREVFAAIAMEGLLHRSPGLTASEIAHLAVKQADALIDALNK